MIDWDPPTVAAHAGARLLSVPAGGHEPAAGEGPAHAAIDSRLAGPGALFVGLPGARTDGGRHAAEALARGAWGVLVPPQHARELCAQATGAVLAHPEPLTALQRLATAWRRQLRAAVVAITGSVGKTSTKDILAALLAPHRRTVASPANFNTEIGLPLAVLGAPAGTEALVLEMAMRGPGQIAELTAIAEPDVGVIVNVGPVHLEQLGSVDAVAAAKAELIGGLAAGAVAVLPAGESRLAPYVRADLRTVTFGDGGDVAIRAVGGGGEVLIGAPGGVVELRPSFDQAHNMQNLLAAVAAAGALGVTPGGALKVEFSALRGDRMAIADDAVLVNDCYNANPMSVRAALEELARIAPARSVAVLGDMLELGAHARELHLEVGRHASACGVGLLIAVGPHAAAIGETFQGDCRRVGDAREAADLLRALLRPRDTVLVKGSRALHLEQVAEALQGADRRPCAAVEGGA